MTLSSIKNHISKKLKKLDIDLRANKKLPLSVHQYDANDIINSMDTLLKGWPTIGPKVKEVENKISKYLKIKNAIMLNSGGSANYLILYLLTSVYAKKEDKLHPGDEVITPAVTWSTTVGPILQNNLTPVFVDVNLGSYDLNVDLIQKSISKKTKAIMLVHPLGYVCDMDKINKLCKKYNLVLIEDTCESIGGKYKNKFAGTFGKFASLSLYQSHHISSVEGGFILTNDNYYADILRSMRANGWLREITNQKTRKKFINENKKIDPSFLFTYIGFNFKPTDLSAALVTKQIDKLSSFIKRRALSAKALIKGLNKYTNFLILPKNSDKKVFSSWFTFPIVIRENNIFSKKDLENFLHKKNIDTRPVIAGNIVRQPFLRYFKYRKGILINSNIVNDFGFFLGLHHKLDKKNIKFIIDAFDSFFKNKLKN